jgi:ubiquinone/menaquinone biosynthesis C-methylase UbiE
MGHSPDPSGPGPGQAAVMATESFQINSAQAETYETQFVPALFAHWVEPVLEAAGVESGQRVLDVACGTGVVARLAADRVGASGEVVGVDLNPAMLAVAARIRPDLTWEQGDVAALPFDDDGFDVVTCQSAMMFFSDPTAALREMGRVTRPGGTVAVQVFDLLGDQPAYGPWVEMVARHAGAQALHMLGTYWAHGDQQVMRVRCADAGLKVSAIHHHERPAYFPSVEAMVLTEVNATPLADRLTPAELDRIVADSFEVYRPFLTDDGLVLPLGGYVVVATPA